MSGAFSLAFSSAFDVEATSSVNASTRDKLAAAANSVEGIHITPYFRQSSRPGDGMVRLERMVRSEDRFWFMNTWQVLIVLPQDLAQAEKYLDERIEALIEAVGQELIITVITSGQVSIDNGSTVPVAVIEGSRSAD